MKRSKKVIGYILLVSGLVRLMFLRDIIFRLFVPNGMTELPFEKLFIPILLVVLGVIVLVSAYRQK